MSNVLFVQPTQPPSLAVQVYDRTITLPAADEDRLYHIAARQHFIPERDDPGKVWVQTEVGVHHTPPDFPVFIEPAQEPGEPWELLAEVVVRAGQTVVEQQHIAEPGWHAYRASRTTSEETQP